MKRALRPLAVLLCAALMTPVLAWADREPAKPAPATNPFQGTWRLVSAKYGDAAEFSDVPKGMRLDGKDMPGVAFDNMQDRSVKGTSDRTRYDVVLDVPEDAAEVHFGVLLVGEGQLWIDDLSLEVVGQDVKPTAMALQVSGRPPGEGPPEGPKNPVVERQAPSHPKPAR